MPKPHIESLDLDTLERGKLHKLWLDMVTDPLGSPVSMPLLIGRGRSDGPVLVLTAAVHGNELNGIPVIQRLFHRLETKPVSGTVIGVPVLNVPAFMRKQRRFVDGFDLNHIMPGKPDGNVSEVYAHRIVDRIISQADYLLDLHTASQGRVNSYYVRADLRKGKTRELAFLQHSQIIVHNPPLDGTLRGAADAMNIPAITIEVGNPNTFQRSLIKTGITGIENVMVHLDMIKGKIHAPEIKPVVCKTSYWMYTDRGGLLNVHPSLTDTVNKGDLIATQYDIFGDEIARYTAPESGIVIGKSVSPVNLTGGRILHLGVIRRG